MKLFHFNPNSYGEEAYVCAESKEEAIAALKATEEKHNPVCHERMVDRMVNCRDKYTIDEYPVGKVVFGEIC